MQKIPLIIFAKIPQAGKVKTRLQPQCTEEQAAEIAKVLLELTIENAVKNWPSEVVVSVWPNQANAYIDSLAAKYPITVDYQISGDLGEKMSSVLNKYAWHGAILGSDVPHLNPDTICSAYLALSSNKNIIAPSKDGGYYLIGFAEPRPEMFDGPNWGEPTVLETTMTMARQHQVKIETLAAEQDIDNWDDLQQARQNSIELDRRLKCILGD